MLLRSQVLTETAALREFKYRSSERSGNPVDMDYLKNTRVRAFYRHSGTMVGGYAVNAAPPLRYRNLVPVHHESEISFLVKNEHDFCEWTCIWFAAGLTHAHRAEIYSRGIVDLLLTGKKYTLGGTVCPAIMLQHTIVLNRPLYRGETTAAGKSVAYLYYASRWSAVRNFIPAVTVYALGRKPRPQQIFEKVIG